MELKRKQEMELLRMGTKQTHIARKMEVNRRTVYDWKKRVENDQGFRNRKEGGIAGWRISRKRGLRRSLMTAQ